MALLSGVKTTTKTIAKKSADIAKMLKQIEKANPQQAVKLTDDLNIKYGRDAVDLVRKRGEFKYNPPPRPPPNPISLDASLVKKGPKEQIDEIVTLADDGVKNIGKMTIKGIKNSAEFIRKNKKLIATGVGVGVIAGIAIAAQIRVDKINSTTYTINSITNNTDDNGTSTDIDVSYTPSDKFSDNDRITIQDTNSVKSIDITLQGKGFTSGEGFIYIEDDRVDTDGNSGTLRCTTSFENQFASITKEVLGATVGVGTDIASNIVESLFNDLFGDFFDNLFGGSAYIIVIVICILIIISSISTLYLYVR